MRNWLHNGSIPEVPGAVVEGITGGGVNFIEVPAPQALSVNGSPSSIALLHLFISRLQCRYSRLIGRVRRRDVLNLRVLRAEDQL